VPPLIVGVARPGRLPYPCPEGSASGCAEEAVRTIVELWRGQLPLGRAFWAWGILGGAVVGLVSTLLAALLLTSDAPAWLAALAFAGHLPWNLVLLVGVWRSAAQPEVARGTATLARLAMLAWVVVLSLL
jgi:hypothetical protein